MTTPAAVAAINWPRVFARCRPEVHKKLLDARSRHEELRRLILEVRGATPKVDFEGYRRALPLAVRPFVEEMEAKAKAFKATKIDTAPLLKELESERAVKIAEAEGFLTNLEAAIGELKAKLGRLQAAKPVDELSLDEVYEMRPELRESFTRAIEADNWSTEEKPEDKTSAQVHH